MGLLSKLQKNSTLKNADILKDSGFFNNRSVYETKSMVINLALSGRLDGGLVSGITTVAGPEATFKTNISLVAVEAFMNKNKDAICLFYDSEHGAPPDYIEACGIDSTRVFHCPIKTIEDLKFDIIKQLTNVDRSDNIIIFIDSVGNLASKKELDDAVDEKSVADMSRAKALKSLFRMITPYLSELDIPMIMINHVYKEMGLFAKTIVSGGCLDADTKVQMSNGELLQISDIKVGDQVRTLIGDRFVTSTWTPETLNDGMPECLELIFSDTYSVICSLNHRFLVSTKTRMKWVAAKNLKLDDDVISI